MRWLVLWKYLCDNSLKNYQSTQITKFFIYIHIRVWVSQVVAKKRRVAVENCLHFWHSHCDWWKSCIIQSTPWRVWQTHKVNPDILYRYTSGNGWWIILTELCLFVIVFILFVSCYTVHGVHTLITLRKWVYDPLTRPIINLMLLVLYLFILSSLSAANCGWLQISHLID